MQTFSLNESSPLKQFAQIAWQLFQKYFKKKVN